MKLTISGQVNSLEYGENREQLRSMAIDTLLKDYDSAKSDGYRRFIMGELDKLGFDRDHRPEDSGNYPNDKD